MESLNYFSYSNRQRLDHHGHLVTHCSNCGQAQPCSFQHLVQDDRINLIKIKTTVLKRFIACEVCGAETKVGKKEEPMTIPAGSWSWAEGAESLAQRTGYPLPSGYTMVNDDTVAALLRRIAARDVQFDLPLDLYMIGAGILGGLSLTSIFYLLYLCGVNAFGWDEFQLIAGGFLIGGISSLLCFSFYKLITHNMTMRRLELRHYMDKLDLDPVRVGKVLVSMEPLDPKVRKLGKQFLDDELARQHDIIG